MSTIGVRLREERERLGMAQPAFAAQGGVQKRAQINYESDGRQPDAAYLAAVATIGVDVQYVVTGVHSSAALAADEQELLALFRAAPLAVKAAAIGALQGGTTGSAPRYTVQQTFHGEVSQQASGDIVNHGGKRKR